MVLTSAECDLSAPCRRALKVAIETVVSEIDIFVSSTGNVNHSGTHEEVEEAR